MRDVIIVSRRRQPSVRLLVRCLSLVRVDARWRRHMSEAKLTVAWGAHEPDAHVNANLISNKLRELQVLTDAGVPCPCYSEAYVDGWLPRRSDHRFGRDLLEPTSLPSFYVERLDLRAEFRVHVWDGAVVALGQKVATEANAHPWIRSSRAGWRVSYRPELMKAALEGRAVRGRAIAAVGALGYDFGAVDVGITSKGKSVVLEVNSAPGLCEYTAGKYVNAIKERLGR